MAERDNGAVSRRFFGYGADDFAEDVAAFMDALDIEAAIVLGHSMGSSIARRFAIRFPERTLGLVLVGSIAIPRDNPAVQGLWEGVSQLNDPVDSRFVREFQESTLAQPVPRAFFDTVLQESQKVPAHVWRGVAGSDMQDDYTKDLDKIDVPTLMLWGDRDGVCSRSDEEEIAAAIADSQLVVYHGAGHGLHWEEPERFASDLAAFARSASR